MLQAAHIEYKKIRNPISVFPKSIFWDCDINKFNLDVWQDRSFIIQRVLKQSCLNDAYLVSLDELFSKEEIKYYAKGSHEIIGNSIIENICIRYDMKHNEFPHYFQNIENLMYA
jgi:hypothetical protein